MSYNVKNYTEQGGDVTHIGGKLVFEEGASVEGLPGSTPAENQAASTAATVAALKDDFKPALWLLTLLRTKMPMANNGREAVEWR